MPIHGEELRQYWRELQRRYRAKKKGGYYHVQPYNIKSQDKQVSEKMAYYLILRDIELEEWTEKNLFERGL